MRFLLGTLLSSGKPPGRPPNLDFVGTTSQRASPSLDPGGIGALEDKATALGVLGKLKREGDLLPLSSSPTLIYGSVLWEEKNGRNGLPIHIFGMGCVKEKRKNMTEIFADTPLALSLLSSLDLY